MRAARQVNAAARRRLTFWLRRTREEIVRPAVVAWPLRRS